MKIRYLGPFAQLTGYARAMHDYCKALIMYNDEDYVDLQIALLFDADSNNLDEEYKDLVTFVDSDSKDFTHNIVHTVPTWCGQFLEKGKKNIAFTTWETSELPSKIAENLKPFDMIVVPSQFCGSIFRKALPNNKVVVIPHCFDTKFWNPYKSVNNFDYSKRCHFLWIGSWNARKNPLGVVKAYLHAFGNRPEYDGIVKLRLHTDKPEAKSEALHLMEISGLDWIPPIDVSVGRMSLAQIRDLHLSHDCYVSLHHGEGFGLGLFESAILGNPVITHGYGGQTEFTRPHIGQVLTPVFYSKDLDCTQYWAEPFIAMASDYMRRLPNQGWSQYNKHTRSYLEDKFSYEVVGDLLQSELEQL